MAKKSTADPVKVEVKDGQMTITAPVTEGRQSGSGKSFNMVKTGMPGIPFTVEGGEYDGAEGCLSLNCYVTHTALAERDEA